MKDKITKQFAVLNERYGWLPSFVLKNMRLLLLLLFAILSIYLVNRINTLVNESPEDEVVATQSNEASQTEAPTASPLTKKPDYEVLSVFNELSTQDVQLESNFDNNRESPF